MLERTRMIGKFIAYGARHPLELFRGDPVARVPRKILEQGLKAVDYPKGPIGFMADLDNRGWYGIPQRNELREEVETETLIRLLRNARQVPDELIANIREMSTVISEFSYSTYLLGTAELSVRRLIHPGHVILDMADKMHRLGFIAEADKDPRGLFASLIYLTRAVDPLLQK